MSDPTLALPFDQYQRYRLVADIVGGLRREEERLDILDVGGRTALLRKFLPNDRVHLVDVDPSPERDLVLGDGSRLPFATASVDAVVTFDTLEHVPPKLREAFLRECRRVARRWVVVAGPYATDGVERAEALLTTFLTDKMGVVHRYLAEHKQNGLPLLEPTEALLGGEGARVVSIGHANLARWLPLMCLELYMDRDPQLRAIAAQYYEFYNGTLYASDHGAPVYRHAVVAVYDDAPLPEPSALLDAPVAPAGTLEPFTDLIRKLIEFDVQRDVIASEWERLERVNGDLFLDLEGHRSTLLVLQENNEQQQEVIEELQGRLIDFVSNEELLVDRIEELEEQIGAHEERGTALEGFLADERKRLSDLQVVADGLQADLQHREGVLRELEQSREDLEQRLDGVNVALGEKQRSLDLVRGELTNQRHINEGLQAALRDRWANLLRALGLK